MKDRLFALLPSGVLVLGGVVMATALPVGWGILGLALALVGWWLAARPPVVGSGGAPSAPPLPDGNEQNVAELQLRVADLEVDLDAAKAEVKATRAEVRRRKQVAQERLEKSTRELREFAFAATHDLQEPLRKIRMFGDLLAEDEAGRLSHGGRAYLQRMRQAADHFEGLLDDLLDLHRPDQVPKAERINLAKVVNEAVEEHRSLLDSTRGEVVVGELATIEADPGQIRRLLFHLLGNAIKFRKPDVPPRVEVTGRYLERPVDGTPCYALTVTDNGIGFDRRYVNRIFQLFQRLHTADEYPGRGIGLTLCRRIVESHDGAITAQSAPDEGSTFIVTLPIQRRQYTLPPFSLHDGDLLPPAALVFDPESHDTR